MEVERVQRWVASALVLTVAALFAGGMAVLSQTVDRAGAGSGLVVISVVVGVAALLGTRVINEKPLLTPWLVLGALPAGVVLWVFHLLR